VKIATPDLVMGDIRPGYSLLCDIDVTTKAGSSISDYVEALAWIEDAHTLEKAEFFAILPDAVTNRLATNSGGNGND
jgi:hypothetical protein